MNQKLFTIFFKVSLVFLFIQNSFAQSKADSLVMAATDSSYLDVGQSQNIGGYYYKVFIFTGILILLIYAALFVYRKLSGQPAYQNSSKIRVLSRQTIGPKQSIVVVLIDDKKYVLGLTDHNVNLIDGLGEISEEEKKVSESMDVKQNFATIMEKLKKK